MVSYEELRQKILVYKSNNNYNMHCINKLWYTLLCCDSVNWQSTWKKQTTESCLQIIKQELKLT